MKIISLVLNNFTNDNRVYKMAKSLSGDGHCVKVVALLKGDVQEHEVFGRLEVHRVRLSSMKWKESLNFFRALKFAEFAWRVVWKYRSQDVWHCNDFEAMFVGVLAKITRPKLKLVYDCHEYERERFGRAKIHLWFTRVFEPLLIRFAKRVIAVSEGIRGEYQRLYKLKDVELIMNTPHFSQPITSNVLREKLRLRSDQKIFLSQGNLTPGRGIELLLHTFSKFPDDKYVLVCMGYGTLVPMIEEFESKFSTVKYHTAVPYSEILYYTSSADYGLNTPQPVSLSYYYSLPNKLFEYIQSEIPILTINIPDCRKIVESNNVGVVIGEYTTEKITEAIGKITSVPREQFVTNLKRIKPDYCWKTKRRNSFFFIARFNTLQESGEVEPTGLYYERSGMMSYGETS